MASNVYRYEFHSSVPLVEIEASLLWSIWAIEHLHGESQARLDIAHILDEKKQLCVIDASTPVGRDLNRLFTGFLGREFGPDVFTVQRVDGRPCRHQEAAA